MSCTLLKNLGLYLVVESIKKIRVVLLVEPNPLMWSVIIANTLLCIRLDCNREKSLKVAFCVTETTVIFILEDV